MQPIWSVCGGQGVTHVKTGLTQPRAKVEEVLSGRKKSKISVFIVLSKTLRVTFAHLRGWA